MEYGFERKQKKKNFLMLQGIVTEIIPVGRGMPTGRGVHEDGCVQMVTLETADSGIVNFMVSADTYILESVNLRPGMEVMFFYDADAPVPLIYPPQYRAMAAARAIRGQNVMVSFFGRDLTSSDGSLKLNINRNVPVRTVNNQTFSGNPGNRYLLVVYDRTTRSIPAQTTPLEVVVLCGLAEE